MKITEQEVASIIFDTEIFSDFKSVTKKEVWGDMKSIITTISSSINDYYLNDLVKISDKPDRFKFLKNCIESELNFYKSH
jgi:hypothetical protein